MHLFLIRHGETVDNAAGIYAGSRDSALTNHGIQQARRLGSWLAENKSPITHVFASPLQRASKTAEALLEAQHQNSTRSTQATIVKVQQLVEQDFGFYEGKPSYARQRDSPRKSGRELHREAHKDDPGFVDVESKDSLARRSDEFLDAHLLPMFDSTDKTTEYVVAIVSHGILLSTLWRRLLLRLPARSVTIARDITAVKGDIVLQHLGGWSNTGFLEISSKQITRIPTPLPTMRSAVKSNVRKDGAGLTSIGPILRPTTPPNTAPQVPSQGGEIGDVGLSEATRSAGDGDSLEIASVRLLTGYSTTVLTIDGKQHLQGFKRTRGGIGRAQYDEKQKTMDAFFKRSKKE